MTEGLSNSEATLSQNSDDAPAEVSASTQTEKTDEKMLAQSRVNELIAKAKRDAHQKGYDAALNSMSTTAPAPVPNVQAQAPAQEQQSVDPNMEQMIAQQVQHAQQQAVLQAQHNNMVTQLAAKIQDAQARHPDFDEVTSRYDFTQHPELLQAANAHPNAGDILYNLAKNPSKLGQIVSTKHDAGLTNMQLAELAQGLQQNHDGTSQKLPQAPLSQATASNVGADNGKMSMSDLKRKYRG